MTEEKSPGGEIASGLRSIFDRVGDFFHIFDLSFFVAGAMTFGALALVYLRVGKVHPFPFDPWVGVLAIVVSCYVSGLISFALGREISGRTFRKHTLHRILPRALEAHNLNVERIAAYTTGEDPRLWWLYIRMWSEIAHEKSAPTVLHHLMRYWAMAATYDAVGFSFIAWAAALVAVQFEAVALEPVGHVAGTASAALCLLAAFFAFRRGANYYEYQIEDVVAHFAVTRARLTTQVTPPPGA